MVKTSKKEIIFKFVEFYLKRNIMQQKKNSKRRKFYHEDECIVNARQSC